LGLITKEVEQKWCGNNKNYLISKGYIFYKLGEKIKVNVHDLKSKSAAKVKVECDYCGKKKIITYKRYTENYFFQKEGKYACVKCAIGMLNRLDFNILKEMVEKISPGYKLLSKFYKNITTPITIQCDKGHIYKTTYGSVRQGCKCTECNKEKWLGENNPRYNPNLTNEEREKKRDTLENINWRNHVFERDNYTCLCCGQHSGNINAHHIDGYEWCKEKRYNIENGVTLCKKCHDKFHYLYGYGNNTKNQYFDFINNNGKLSKYEIEKIRMLYKSNKKIKLKLSMENVLDIKWMLKNTDLTQIEIGELIGRKGVSISSIKNNNIYSYYVLDDNYRPDDLLLIKINKQLKCREEIIHKNCKAIICLNNLKKFKSITTASKTYNIAKTSISKCCQYKSKSAGKHPETGEKLRWMYYDEYIKQQNKSA
jgi:hypothetical protein